MAPIHGKTAAPLAILMCLAAHGAAGEPYCANYNDGTRTCGIPTLESCQQAIVGVGGDCGSDASAQLPPPLIAPLQRALEPDSPPVDPIAMPPPPDE
jgi:hypothetical protein